jgi:hypothetical protein
LTFCCDAVDLGKLFSGDFAGLPFSKLQSPDADEAAASIHILAVLCRDDRLICFKLISYGLFHLPANCEANYPFGSLFAAFCRSPNPEIFAALVLLPRVFQSHDPVCVDYGLSATERRVTNNPETAEALFRYFYWLHLSFLRLGMGR